MINLYIFQDKLHEMCVQPFGICDAYTSLIVRLAEFVFDPLLSTSSSRNSSLRYYENRKLQGHQGINIEK